VIPAYPVVKDAVAGELLPPLELNATEKVDPAHRAYKVIVASAINGEETVVPVAVLDQPKNV
jgi:hypothetical protein